MLTLIAALAALGALELEVQGLRAGETAVRIASAPAPAVVDGERRPYFEGDRFNTARFGRVVTKVYEALDGVETMPDAH